MTATRALILLAAISLGGCVHRTAASARSVWRLRGAVATIQPDLVTVRHKTGQLVQLVIDDQTVFIRRHERESIAALRPGVRVSITVETTAQRLYRAHQVELFGEGRTVH